MIDLALAKTDHKSDIPKVLREERERSGLTQLEAAERLGLHELSVSRWETGAREPGTANFQRAVALYPRGTSADPWSALVAKTEREAVRRGATDAEADFLRAALDLPQARALVAQNGANEAQAAALALSLLDWVDRRHHPPIELKRVKPKDLPAVVAAAAERRRQEIEAEQGVPKRRKAR